MRFAFCILFLVVSSNVLAGEISLLASYKFAGYDPPDGFDNHPPADPPPFYPSVPHLFTMGTSSYYTTLEVPATPENDGKTFYFDESTIVQLRDGFISGSSVAFVARLGIPGPYFGNMPPPSYFDAKYAFRNVNSSNWQAEALVPQLGPNFYGYHIDALTVTIGYPMLIEIYGHPVPEPTFAIVLLSCAALVLGQRYRRPRYQLAK